MKLNNSDFLYVTSLLTIFVVFSHLCERPPGVLDDELSQILDLYTAFQSSKSSAAFSPTLTPIRSSNQSSSLATLHVALTPCFSEWSPTRSDVINLRRTLTLLKSLVIHNSHGDLHLHVHVIATQFVHAYLDPFLRSQQRHQNVSFEYSFHDNNFVSCSDQRFFLPQTLASVDKCLFLSNDVLIVGSLRQTWTEYSQKLSLDTPLYTSRDFFSTSHDVMFMDLSALRSRQYIRYLSSLAYLRAGPILPTTFSLIGEVLPCTLRFRPLYCTSASQCPKASTTNQSVAIVVATPAADDVTSEQATFVHSVVEAYQEIDVKRHDLQTLQDLIKYLAIWRNHQICSDHADLFF